MRSRVSIPAAAALLALAGCGMVDGRGDGLIAETRPVPRERFTPVSDRNIKIGERYEVGGVGYSPADETGYEAVGYASWYGDELRGNRTANGERFDPDGISAAHRTLPMPSYIEVTSLDTGKTILVRVNDRGPFSKDRLIDLSRGAARQLGISGRGHAAVRVRRVDPSESERETLRGGGKARERRGSSESELAALRRKIGMRATRNAELAARPSGDYAKLRGDWYVQLGAFESETRADALANRSGARVDRVDGLYRVRVGPFETEPQANDSLRVMHRKGYPEARILRGS